MILVINSIIELRRIKLVNLKEELMMKAMFNKNQKIGEIAAIFPKATDIFMDYEIDFCCGGDRPLEVAIVEQGISEDEMLYKLNKAYEEFKESVKYLFNS